MASSIKLIAGNSNRPLAEAIAAHVGIALTKSQVKRFADMEIFVEIQENVRGEDVYIIQSTSFPTNDHLMELLIMVDAARRASAERISRALAAQPLAGDVTVTAAIGAALFPRHGREFDDLISAADIAMYSAKSTGVTHRLADVHAVELAAEELGMTSGYHGPDRRRHPSEVDVGRRD